MRRVGQARKRDAAEKPIVQALKQAGAMLIRVSEKGAPDLVVYHPRSGVRLLEVKSRGGTATAAQERRSLEGWPIVTVRTVDDALKALGLL